jgi:hypothetical protein
MSKIEVDAIEPQSGTTLTIGASGDSVNIASGATITDFTSTGIDDNATSTAITIDSSENVGIGTTNPTDTNGYGKALDIQGSTGAAIYVGSSGDRGIFGYTSGEQHISNPSASGTTRFYINGTEQMRINSAGAMLLGTTTAGSASAGDLVVNGGVFLGGTAAANELDDYEEGDWTPTLIGGGGSAGSHAYNVQYGAYVKIGHLVVLTGYVSLTNKGSYSGQILLGNFPFTVDSGQKYYSGTTFYNASLTLPSLNYGAGAYPTPNQTYAQMFSQNSSGSSNLDWSAINNNSQIGAFTIAYISA